MDDSPTNPKALRIFLVENHPDTSKWLALYLESRGHTVISAQTVTAALAAIPGAGCEVLLSDIGLADGDGWGLLRALRPKNSLYPIAMSGVGLNADKAKSAAAGYRHHLVKPFSPIELDAALDEAARELSGGKQDPGG